MEHVLVTGGAGFIGSHLVRRLVEDGADVTVLDDLSSGSMRNLEGVDCRLVEADILDERVVQQVAKGADRVFHLAAMVSVPKSIEDPVACYDINLMGSLNVLRAANRAGASTGCAELVVRCLWRTGRLDQRKRTHQPHVALCGGQVGHGGRRPDLQLGLQPAHRVPALFQRLWSAPIPRALTTRRPSRHSSQAMLNGQAPTILGDGQQTRDFVFVDDIVRANLLAAETPGAAGGVFNVGGGQAVSVLDLVDRFRKAHPRRAAGRIRSRRLGRYPLFPGRPDACRGRPRLPSDG